MEYESTGITILSLRSDHVVGIRYWASRNEGLLWLADAMAEDFVHSFIVLRGWNPSVAYGFGKK